MAARLLSGNTVMVLGGAGLVGRTVARRLGLLLPAWRPARIIVASLLEQEAQEAAEGLQKEHEECTGTASVEFIPEWGDVFLRTELAMSPRDSLMKLHRKALLVDLYDDLSTAYEQSHLVKIMRKHSPQVLIDSVNTATGLSYQNTFDAAQRVRQALFSTEDDEPTAPNMEEEAERMLLSQSVPHLVRHIQILSKVAQEQGLETYLKIGTTGTGGMGLNLPYTHSESRPSSLILAKNEAAFGHTGLLYLWSQTPGAPTVHEVKPGAAIGYRNIAVHYVSDRYGNEYIRKPQLLQINVDDGNSVLNVREDEAGYCKLDKMATLAVDMGENGLLTADEFRTLSAPGSMEMISPEEIAEVCVQEILGVGTGNNVLAAIRGGVLQPGYRAGTIRSFADQLLTELENSHKENSTTPITMPSVAIGKLGPPYVSKILFEAHILKLQFRGPNGLKQLAACDPSEIARKLSAEIQEVVRQDSASSVNFPGSKTTLSSLAHVAPTVGVPILLEGNSMLRGPNITVPEPVGHDSRFDVTTPETVNTYANKGWVDLRTSNLQVWKERASHILSEPSVSLRDTTLLMGIHYNGSGKHNEIDATALATWILAGEMKGVRDLNIVHCGQDEHS